MTLRRKQDPPDFGFLDSAFPGKIRGTDLDFFLEMNDQLLCIEFKGVGVDIPQGQQLSLECFARKAGTVIIAYGVWGHEREQECSAIQFLGHEPFPCTLAQLNEICASWARWSLYAGEFPRWEDSPHEGHFNQAWIGRAPLPLPPKSAYFSGAKLGRALGP